MRPTYARATWFFLRVLGVVYLLAFWSLATQVLGLIGDGGILPARLTMSGARAYVAAQHIGLDRFHLLPTLCWVSTSDAFLQALCFGGMGLALLLMFGFAPAAVLALLWLDYLSLSVVGREFLSYQWDALLLETGFLAVFLAPLVMRDRARTAIGPPRLAVWLMLWLLFRLMFGSGAVKLASGDPTWRNLTALAFHYETQPIPTPLAWYAHQLPVWFQKGSTAAVMTIELITPFFILGPRRLRLVAFVLLGGLQVTIALTGNYAFFNLLAAALCLFLLDDETIASAGRASSMSKTAYVQTGLVIAVAVITVPVSLLAFTSSLRIPMPAAGLIAPVAELVAPFHSVNRYGLFAVMTTSRPEIIVEGSEDGLEWRAYEFKYKAGDLQRRPAWVAPHQPRLDWQMWFAALGRFEGERWFQNFCQRLFDGSPAVRQLLAHDPFDGRPPKYLRAELYRYQFSGRDSRVWWARERLGNYSPVMSVTPAAR